MKDKRDQANHSRISASRGRMRTSPAAASHLSRNRESDLS